MMTIGDRIKHICDQRGLTQLELARRANVTEVSMSRYINGFREPKARVIVDIANALDITTDYILGRTDENGTCINHQAVR